jgi:DNA-binding GntR family transcriptional regulator
MSDDPTFTSAAKPPRSGRKQAAGRDNPSDRAVASKSPRSPLFSTLAIRRVSTVDQVVDAVSKAILNGELPPGTPLREMTLVDTLQVSRNTVREATRLLQTDGLVVYQLNRGAVGAELGHDDVVDLFRCRALIEQEAANAAIANRELLRQLRKLADDTHAAASADAPLFYEADRAFHTALVSALESPRITRFYASVQRELRLALVSADRKADSLLISAVQHQKLTRALAKDVNQARELIADHLATAVGDIGPPPERG